ncbi:hypothetical protein M3Y94_00654700 [Aphelenchoides besseyi]|nr:hypothetical protein M3Y94_00654700 [Aphelenchoides besseyi]KAI6231171.1 hypothetical protein M3Y95_00353200 [Aphelenchoides besseyi]
MNRPFDGEEHRRWSTTRSRPLNSLSGSMARTLDGSQSEEECSLDLKLRRLDEEQRRSKKLMNLHFRTVFADNQSTDENANFRPLNLNFDSHNSTPIERRSHSRVPSDPAVHRLRESTDSSIPLRSSIRRQRRSISDRMLLLPPRPFVSTRSSPEVDLKEKLRRINLKIKRAKKEVEKQEQLATVLFPPTTSTNMTVSSQPQRQVSSKRSFTASTGGATDEFQRLNLAARRFACLKRPIGIVSKLPSGKNLVFEFLEILDRRIKCTEGDWKKKMRDRCSIPKTQRDEVESEIVVLQDEQRQLETLFQSMIGRLGINPTDDYVARRLVCDRVCSTRKKQIEVLETAIAETFM